MVTSTKFYVLSFACVPIVIGIDARKNERKAHRQRCTALAYHKGGIDLHPLGNLPLIVLVISYFSFLKLFLCQHLKY